MELVPLSETKCPKSGHFKLIIGDSASGKLILNETLLSTIYNVNSLRSLVTLDKQFFQLPLQLPPFPSPHIKIGLYDCESVSIVSAKDLCDSM